MTTDYNQTWQDVGQLEDAALQEFGTLLNDLGIRLPGLPAASASPAGSSSKAGLPPGNGLSIHPSQAPTIGDPPISATEGSEWNGMVASISDSDGDGTYDPPDTVSGTIDWGDNSSTPFNLSVPEGGTANLFNGHMWMETGSYTVTVTASDTDGGQSQASETVRVADGQLSWQANPPDEWNQPFHTVPTITTPSNQTNTEGDNVSLQIHASDTDGDTLSYDALDLPPGLSINSSTGLITGTVADGAAEESGGTYNPIILVDDGQDGSVQDTFS